MNFCEVSIHKQETYVYPVADLGFDKGGFQMQAGEIFEATPLYGWPHLLLIEDRQLDVHPST